MINEDYVSFETAKLLKEKGFMGDVQRWYVISAPEEGVVTIGFGNKTDYVQAPTLQMARKWLIENYNIHIEVRYFPMPDIYRYVIIHSPATFENIGSHSQYFNKDEEACEAAIKYCLENLI